MESDVSVKRCGRVGLRGESKGEKEEEVEEEDEEGVEEEGGRGVTRLGVKKRGKDERGEKEVGGKEGKEEGGGVSMYVMWRERHARGTRGP